MYSLGGTFLSYVLNKESIGHNCPVFEKELRRANRQFPAHLFVVLSVYVHPLWFASAQLQLTKAVVHIFNEQAVSADVYLEWLFRRWISVPCCSGLFSTRSVISSTPFRFSGLLLKSIRRLRPQAELTTWQAFTFFTKKQLQSLLGKFSFVPASVKHVKPGRIFMARLLNYCYPGQRSKRFSGRVLTAREKHKEV